MLVPSTRSLSLTRDGTFNVNDKIKDLHMYNDLDYMIRKYIEDDDQISCFFTGDKGALFHY